jgi:ubiquinone biosynthesis protein
VFARFDPEPLAAASIAQVHRAQLPDGAEVVVKIRRPGIRDTIDTDLHLLARLAAVAEAEMPALKPYRPRQMVRELARSLRRELDLAGECRNAERIAANLADLPWMVVPKVHWAHTGERVNVQDYIDGVPGPSLARLDALGSKRWYAMPRSRDVGYGYARSRRTRGPRRCDFGAGWYGSRRAR